MKKKLMMVAVLLGALSLGACVDDNESASVTAIRNAKAAQLEALASYANAQAEAELILANAEAAIKAAQAAYEEAMAKLKDLEAQEKEIEVQKLQATLETDLAAAQAQAEAELIAAQAQLEQAKAALIAASDQTDMATQAKIQNLINAANAIMYGGSYYVMTSNFDENSNSWTTSREVTIAKNQSLIGDANSTTDKGLKLQLIDVNANLVTAQYDLEDTKIKIQQYVEDEKAELAKNEALLKALNDNKTTDREDAEKAYDAAVAAKPAFDKAWDEAEKAYDAAAYGTEGAITKAVAALNQTELTKFLDGVVEYPYNSGNYYWIQSLLESYGYISFETPEVEVIEVTYDDGTYGSNILGYSTAKIVTDEDALSADITAAERELAVQKALLADAQKAYTDGTKADNVTYKAYVDAVAAAQEAFNDDPTAANKSALEAAESALKGYISGLQGPVDTAEGNVEEAQANVDILKEAQTKLTGDVYAAYSTVYDAYVAAVKASKDSYIAWMKAGHNLTVQNNLISSLFNIISDYTDWATEIESVEEDIRTNNKNIAAMTDDGTTTGGYTEASRQAYIDALTVEKASLEQEIAIKQAQYDNYIEQVKVLIGDTETAGE